MNDSYRFVSRDRFFMGTETRKIDPQTRSEEITFTPEYRTEHSDAEKRKNMPPRVILRQRIRPRSKYFVPRNSD